MRIAVVGAGAIGGYVGAALHRGGADVHLVARGANLAAIREHGVRVLSERGDFTAHAPATDDPAEIGPVDVVFLGLKAYQYASAGPAAGAAAARDDGRRRGAERPAVVVLPRLGGPVRGPPHRGGRSRRRDERGDRAGARDRLRRLLRDRARGAGRDPPHRGHAVLDRRARRHDLRALRALQRGDDRRRPEVPGRARHPERHLGQADGQRRVQPAVGADARDDGARSRPIRRRREVVAAIMAETVDDRPRRRLRAGGRDRAAAVGRRARRRAQDVDADGSRGRQAARARRDRHRRRRAGRSHRRRLRRT